MRATDILTSCRLVNFKAIRTTRPLRLTPLTVFIGNNGSGKSSVVEGLRTLQVMTEEGIDAAMQLWRGVQHAYNKAAPTLQPEEEPRGGAREWGMAFFVAGQKKRQRFQALVELVPSADRDGIDAVREELRRGVLINRSPRSGWERQNLDTPLLRQMRLTERWQFLNLVPQNMMPPVPRKTTGGKLRLADDGRNIAEYLDEIRKLNPSAADGIIEAMRFVVPFMSDVRAESASLVEKTVYLNLIEPGLAKSDSSATPERTQVPGWMMSTGTLRALAIIAALRHPDPPTLLVVEEIENSLDPRTLGMVMAEIGRAVKAKRTQVILTTHSPQLLDMVALEQLVLVQRDAAGEPTFRRPAEIAELRQWAKEFTLGEMLSRGLFRQLS